MTSPLRLAPLRLAPLALTPLRLAELGLAPLRLAERARSRRAGLLQRVHNGPARPQRAQSSRAREARP